MENGNLKKCSCGGQAKLRSKYLISHVGWGKSYFSYWVECEQCGKTSKYFNDIDHIHPNELAESDWNGGD